MSVGEAAGPFLGAAFVLCLLGTLAGAGSFKATHLSEDPAYRLVVVGSQQMWCVVNRLIY
jgi:hypothetical protein